MKSWILGVTGVALVLATGCSSSNPTTTTAATNPPVASSSADATTPGTVGTTPSGTDKAAPDRTGTTGRAGGTTKGTTGGTTPGSGGPGVELNTWKVDSAKGPFQKEFAAGGKVSCTYNTRGNVWELRAASEDAKFGAIQLLFEDPAKPNEAKVEITTPGNKDTLGEGKATLTIKDAGNNVVTFGVGISYRDTTATGGESGELQATGACRQEQRPKQK